ncbi:tRNA preQ1(34) S-adenosylmethionine ribosyltransferase-isomerase QueA [soil metagenome]
MSFRIEQFNYELPPALIAQTPANPRDSSRMLVLDRVTGEIQHKHFFNLPDFLSDNDVLVRNNTKVIPARIFGQKDTGGKCEILLVQHVQNNLNNCEWECMTKPGLRENQTVSFAESSMVATCIKITGYTRILQFGVPIQDFYLELNRLGKTPIPPYIHWAENDEENLRELYQTTYAKIQGSAAAPTAGLHFTKELDKKLHERGVSFAEVTLHVGLGTFLPLLPEQIEAGKLHHEMYEITEETAQQLNQAKKAGKKIVAVGTTTTRTLETLADSAGVLHAGVGQTDLFIQPGTAFKFVDKMITNFHLPKSSLLMLVSAFTTEPNAPHQFNTFLLTPVGQAYEIAITEQYRFFSFGDGMLIK